MQSYSRLNKPSEFLSDARLDVPLHVDAEIYLKDGPSFLRHHLPFWTAVWAGRFVKIVIPLFACIPAAKNLMLRLKLARVYEELKAIERNALNSDLKERNQKISRILKEGLVILRCPYLMPKSCMT